MARHRLGVLLAVSSRRNRARNDIIMAHRPLIRAAADNRLDSAGTCPLQALAQRLAGSLPLNAPLVVVLAQQRPQQHRLAPPCRLDQGRGSSRIIGCLLLDRAHGPLGLVDLILGRLNNKCHDACFVAAAICGNVGPQTKRPAARTTCVALADTHSYRQSTDRHTHTYTQTDTQTLEDEQP